ncbi:asparaginase domain-containing protein [Marinospirillum perlucidum]|uniref:asparaginase domain-containing protein n=1 Tax=Marinospirillum perlucidum TaxID=1982602 RepID=UPI000DF3EAB7|nr:asparaginase domain-containing protein [Marinospirillum perlucidum]
MSVKRLKVIYTGGTLGMLPSPQGLQAAGDFQQRLEKALPSDWLKRQQLDLDLEAWQPPLDSSAMQPSDWFQLAALARKAESDYHGLVILQGTDTLAWTASALFWLLPDFSLPLILTGAQYPLEAPLSDALSNLQEAFYWASQENFSGIYLSFNQQLFDPRSCRKGSSQERNAFASVDKLPLGHLDKPPSQSALPTHPGQALPRLSEGQLASLACDFQPRILRLPLIPGLPQDWSLTGLENLDGLLLEGLGSGTTPPLPAFFQQLATSQLPVGLISQCWSGGVHYQYAASQALIEAKVVSLGKATPESAQTCLTWLLALSRENLVSDQKIPELWRKYCI